MKYMQYQLVGVSGAVTIGICVVDAEILRQSGVSTEIWRPTDFAYDILVLKWTSCDSVQKIQEHTYSDVSDALACDVVPLMVMLVVTRLCLFLVNSALTDSK